MCYCCCCVSYVLSKISLADHVYKLHCEVILSSAENLGSVHCTVGSTVLHFVTILHGNFSSIDCCCQHAVSLTY
jgi:hypothetical protein